MAGLFFCSTKLFWLKKRLQVTRCSAPLQDLAGVWRPLPFINRLKSFKNDPLFGHGILELDSEKIILKEPVNVLFKSISNIYLRCPMYFAKFPFDDQSCIFEMVLDEVLHVNMTLHTQIAAITERDFHPSEQSYNYEVSNGIWRSLFWSNFGILILSPSLCQNVQNLIIFWLHSKKRPNIFS